MQKIIGLLSLGVIAIVGAFLWHKNAPEQKLVGTPNEEKISVIATFYPLEELARSVGGDRISVRSIVPTGAEPHEYEPSTQDILSVYEADVFLLNGAGVDAWAEKIRPELEQRGVKVRQMSENISLLSHAPEEEGEEAETNPYDSHFWLDPVNAQEEARAIATTLIERDPAGEVAYLERRDETLEKLSALDNEYRNGLKVCRQNTIITSHNAFSYLAERYGFMTLSISGISPEAEPSPRRLAELANVMQEKKIKYVFFETLVSPKVSETLARETGATALVFNPIEGLSDEERGKGEDYFTIMRKNLNNLKTALECQ